MYRIIIRAAIVVALLAGGILAAGAAAHAVQLEPADRQVSRVRVAYVEPVGRRALYVEFNNGATYRLRPCRFEDSRHCYWDADDRGNGRGRSFVAVAGRVLYSPAVGMARDRSAYRAGAVAGWSLGGAR